MVAVLETHDARILLGCHAHVCAEASFQRARIDVLVSCPLHDGQRPAAEMNVPQQSIDCRLPRPLTPECPQEKTVHASFHLLSRASAFYLIVEIEQCRHVELVQRERRIAKLTQRHANEGM